MQIHVYRVQAVEIIRGLQSKCLDLYISLQDDIHWIASPIKTYVTSKMKIYRKKIYTKDNMHMKYLILK